MPIKKSALAFLKKTYVLYLINIKLCEMLNLKISRPLYGWKFNEKLLPPSGKFYYLWLNSYL